MTQIRGLQAQLADARQKQKEQAADKAALQARLQAANDKSAAQDAEKGKLQASGALLFSLCCPYTMDCTASVPSLQNIPARVALVVTKRRYYTFRRQVNQKPSIIPGCSSLVVM